MCLKTFVDVVQIIVFYRFRKFNESHKLESSREEGVVGGNNVFCFIETLRTSDWCIVVIIFLFPQAAVSKSSKPKSCSGQR